MPKTKFWIILFSALFIIGVGAFILLQNIGGAGLEAEIRVNGEFYDSVDLSAVAAPYNIIIETLHGRNTVHVENGQISMIYSNCRDQICVRQGAITGPGIPIVCLPNRVVIVIGGEP